MLVATTRCEYASAFDVADRPWIGAWWVALAVLLGVALAAWSVRHWGRSYRRRNVVIPVLLTGVLLSAFASYGYERDVLRRELRSGRVGLAVGQVLRFHAMPWAGHEYEEFTVDGVRFAYSNFVMTPAFNDAASHGGPIAPGKTVRISYSLRKRLAGTPAILKIEVGHC
jgi:hypothetical protein